VFPWIIISVIHPPYATPTLLNEKEFRKTYAFILEPEYLTKTSAKPNRAKPTLWPYPCTISSLPIEKVIKQKKLRSNYAPLWETPQRRCRLGEYIAQRGQEGEQALPYEAERGRDAVSTHEHRRGDAVHTFTLVISLYLYDSSQEVWALPCI